jgi:16S rRNA (cytosine967-C5)-methyltransferase
MAGRLPFPDRDRDPVGRLALEHSHPEWMVTVVMERLGAAETEDWCRANNQPAPLTVRVNRLRTSVERFTAELDRAGIAWRPGHYYEYAVELLRPGPLDAVPGFEQGHFLVQDEASMLVAAVLDPRAGERVLDACAAPGGKATHLAELMDDQGLVLANDARAARVQLIHENRKRLALQCMEVRTGDARELGEVYPAHFHRVLVDAPCSGLGVLARRPDARWRRQPADVEALARLQYELLVASARCVRPGGTLVYSVCTLTPAEGQGVIDAFLATEAQFCLEPSTGPLDPALFAQALPGGVLELWPHRHGTDGFFVARLVRST